MGFAAITTSSARTGSAAIAAPSMGLQIATATASPTTAATTTMCRPRELGSASARSDSAEGGRHGRQTTETATPAPVATGASAQGGEERARRRSSRRARAPGRAAPGARASTGRASTDRGSASRRDHVRHASSAAPAAGTGGGRAPPASAPRTRATSARQREHQVAPGQLRLVRPAADPAPAWRIQGAVRRRVGSSRRIRRCSGERRVDRAGDHVDRARLRRSGRPPPDAG